MTVATEHAKRIAKILHDEKEFDILRRIVLGRYYVLWVYYPKCPNGNKIMVFEADNAPKGIEKSEPQCEKIMPHFGAPDSPFARFEATERGWWLALRMTESLAKDGV